MPFSIDSLEQVLASGKGTDMEKMDVMIQLSTAYVYVDTAKCRMYAMEAFKMAQNTGSKLIEGRANNALGNYYWVGGSSPYQAHAYYIRAEKIFLELGNEDMLYITYRNMMGMYSNMEVYDNTVYYANKVQTMAVERKDWRWILYAQFHIGNVQFQDNKDQEALDYFLNLHRRALHIEDSLGFDHYLSTTIGIQCVRIYNEMNHFAEGMPYLYQLLAQSKLLGIKSNFGLTYANLAMTHAMMHNVDSAKYYIQKAKDSYMSNTHKLLVYFASAKVDSLKGNYLSALANFQKFHQITDSLSKEEKTTKMARLKLWHEFDQKELENTLMQQEYQKQRKLILILVISLVMILMLLAIAVFFYWKITEKNREITEKNHEMKELHTVKDKLFSVVAHDLRSPMGALMSVLKLANRNMLDAETQAQLLKNVSDQVDDTYGLIDNLLCWSKSQMQGIVPTPVYFNAQQGSRSVTDCLQTLAANKQIVLENRIEAQQVYADRDMFDVVVRNLTANAIKYTSVGGEVILASELSGDMLTVSVKDTGTGMSQEVQDKLFKLSETKSQRGTGNESGTGLGLVLCADFVKANGGNIWFTSVQGEGSTFFFSIPVKG